MLSFLSLSRIYTLLLASLLLISAGSFADDRTEKNTRCALLTTPYTATYYGSYKGWRLDATQQLKKQSNSAANNQGWKFTLKAINPMGHINQSSQFNINEQGKITSADYHHEKKVLFKTRNTHSHFDWTKKQAVSTRKEKKYTIALQGNELDELNYQLALRCDLVSGLKEFSYAVAERKKIDVLDFKIVGEERLSTDLGELDTVIVKRVRNNTNRITTLWFAKDLDYLMVKLLQEERRDTEAYLLYIKNLGKN